MKKYLVKILALALLTLPFLLQSKPVNAHVLETDKSIGAVLHIDPDDDPIAGQKSTFYFDFRDTTNKLSLTDCDCLFTVKEGGTQIYSAPLSVSSTKEGVAGVTFPTRDVYSVQITGKPLNGADFSGFTLSYDIRVDRGTVQLNASRRIKPLQTSLVIGVVITAAYLLLLGYYVATKPKKL